MCPRRCFGFCGAASLLALGWLASWTVAEWQFQAGLKQAGQVDRERGADGVVTGPGFHCVHLADAAVGHQLTR